MSTVREHAVVVGAGMAGLLAAAATSKFYESITVVERDVLPDGPAHRKGVPQGRHLHSFLTRGPQILEELLPGVLAELGAAGAVVVDGDDLSRVYARVGRYELSPSGKLADPPALRMYLGSRQFMEFHVRRRVAALGNVAVLDGHDMVDPVVTSGAVTGVRLRNRCDGVESTLDAELVIDARGRTARIPAFLETHGYPAPFEQTCASHWAYSSQLMELSEPGFVERLAMVNNGPRRPRALLVAYEHGRWMLAIGRSAEVGSAPTDFTAMLEFAADAFPARIVAALRTARPVGELAVFRNTGSVWRRYDQLTRFPAGFLVIGDALCNLNPLYGQGMTMAALESLALRDCLQSGRDELWQPFFTASAERIEPVWVRNRVNDRLPGSTRPTVRRRVRKWPQKWLAKASMRAAATDVRVAEQFLRVNNLVDPPTRLRSPMLLSRIVIGRFIPRPGPSGSSDRTSGVRAGKGS